MRHRRCNDWKCDKIGHEDEMVMVYTVYGKNWFHPECYVNRYLELKKWKKTREKIMGGKGNE